LLLFLLGALYSSSAFGGLPEHVTYWNMMPAHGRNLPLTVYKLYKLQAHEKARTTHTLTIRKYSNLLDREQC